MVDGIQGPKNAGQTFSNKGIKLTDLKEKNPILFEYFKKQGVEVVYDSDIQKFKDAFAGDDKEFSKRELKKLGLDLGGDKISRKDAKEVNRMMAEIEATALAEDGSYPVKVDDKTTEYFSGKGVRTLSLTADADKTTMQYYDKTGETVQKTVVDQKGLGRTTVDDTSPHARVVTYEGDQLIATKGGVKQEIYYVENQELMKDTLDVNGTEKTYKKDLSNNTWVEQKPEVKPEPEPEPEPVVPNFKETFEKAGKKVTVDETGSTQRFGSKQQWETGVAIPKNATYDENGYPDKMAIALPGDYGAKGADGVGQKRFHTLTSVDAEQHIYQSPRGERSFQVNIGEDGKITLKQVHYENGKVSELTKADSDAVDRLLDKDVKTLEKAAVDNVEKKTGKATGADDKLSRENTVIDIKTKGGAENVAGDLKNRNNAWGIYAAVGSDNGSWTGNLGLIEHLAEDHKLDKAKIEGAIHGLITRVPEKFQRDADYTDLVKLFNDYKAGNSVKIRDIDKKLIEMAKKMNIQGTNYMPNEFLRGGNGAVMIEPDDKNSMWNSDAKFKLPTTSGKSKDFYFYRNDTVYDKCYDFQDIIGRDGDGALIANDTTGNNRKGELTFHAEQLDADEEYYFQTSGGKEIPVIVKDGVGYVQDENGKMIKINDILNGRAKMPDGTPAARTAPPATGGGHSAGGSTVYTSPSTGLPIPVPTTQATTKKTAAAKAGAKTGAAAQALQPKAKNQLPQNLQQKLDFAKQQANRITSPTKRAEFLETLDKLAEMPNATQPYKQGQGQTNLEYYVDYTLNRYNIGK